MVTLAFDDSYDTCFSVVMPELEERGMKGTFYSLATRIANGGWLTTPDLQEIAANGHEIASHTMSHPNLTTLNDDDLIWELEESKLWLEEVTGQEVVSFAPPMGYTNDRVLKAVREYYDNSRGGYPGTNISGDDSYLLKSYEVSSRDSVSSVIAKIDRAIENDEWLILFWHRFTDKPTGWTYLTDDFIEILEHLEDRGVRVVTTKKGVELMRCLQE